MYIKRVINCCYHLIWSPITYTGILLGRDLSLHCHYGQEEQLQRPITLQLYIWTWEYCFKMHQIHTL